MTPILRPDICVIGAGAGGLSVAAAAAALGVSVVLIEKGRMGGECLNAGCVPSKALRAAARRAHLAAAATPFGIVAEPRIAFGAVMDHVRAVVADIARNDSRERFEGMGVTVIAAAARFADSSTVIAGDVRVQARRFVIATGSSPAVPAIAGLDATPYLTNDTVFALPACPSHLVVIGGGAVGLGFAQSFRRLGARVTVLDSAPLLAHEDEECRAVVCDALRREDIRLHEQVAIVATRATAEGIEVVIRGEADDAVVRGSHLLIATGRAPNVADLDLAKAGIDAGPLGVVVGKGLRTTNRRVYAIGDVTGGPFYTHAANDQAGLVIRSALFRMPVDATARLTPRVIDTDPCLAHVGLTETQARTRHRGVRVVRWPYHENDRARAERATDGHIKIVTTAHGRILGATIVGARAEDLIGTWVLALSQRLNIRAMATPVVPYPTYGEIGKRAAMSFFTPRLTGSAARRIIRWLGKFG